MITKYFKLTEEFKINDSGVKLFRIKALIDFKVQGVQVKKGELGGWVEEENNLKNFGWCISESEIYNKSRVVNSLIDKSRVVNSLIDKSRVVNSLIDNGRVVNSLIGNGWVVNSFVFNESRVVNSRVFNSWVENSLVIDSRIVNNGLVENSRVENSLVENSRVENSWVDNFNPISLNVSYYSITAYITKEKEKIIQVGCYRKTVDEWLNLSKEEQEKYIKEFENKQEFEKCVAGIKLCVDLLNKY